MDQEAETFLSVSSNPSSSSYPTDDNFDLNSTISHPTVLLYLSLLSVILFVFCLLHLLIRLLLRPKTELDDAYDEENATALQGRLQTLLNLHNSGVDHAGVQGVVKMVKCKKVKHQSRKGKPKIRETCTRRNLRILRRIVPDCGEVDDEEALILKSIQHLMILKSQVTFLRKLADVCGV